MTFALLLAAWFAVSVALAFGIGRANRLTTCESAPADPEVSGGVERLAA